MIARRLLDVFVTEASLPSGVRDSDPPREGLGGGVEMATAEEGCAAGDQSESSSCYSGEIRTPPPITSF